MISRWLAKIVITIAVIGFLAVELGSPFWTRAQLDGTAHDVADEAAFELRKSNNSEQARVAAARLATNRDARLTGFRIDPDSRVHVTVYRKARSYLLHRFDQTKDWYDVSVKADAVPPD